MNYYLIRPSTIAGYSIISEGKSYDYPKGTFPVGTLVMEIDSFDYHKHLFVNENINHLFVTSHFKPILENEGFPELVFRKLDTLIIGPNLGDNYPNHGFSRDNFWMLEIREGGKDFIKLRSNLIVSERVLELLYIHDAFADNDEGAIYGAEFKILTNKFFVEGEIEDFIRTKMPVYRENIKVMRQKIYDESRRREDQSGIG